MIFRSSNQIEFSYGRKRLQLTPVFMGTQAEQTKASKQSPLEGGSIIFILTCKDV